jgi:hypothetical protein
MSTSACFLSANLAISVNLITRHYHSANLSPFVQQDLSFLLVFTPLLSTSASLSASIRHFTR